MSDPIIKDYTPVATTAGLTGLAYKGFSDLERIDRLAGKWESNLDDYRNTLKWDRLSDANFRILPEVADNIFDTYIRDGRRLAKSKFLGIPMGKFLEKLRPESASHYQLYTDSKYNMKDVRLHMMQKAWNANTHARPQHLGGWHHIPEITRVKDLKVLEEVPDELMPKRLKNAWRKIITSDKDLKISQMIKMLDDAADTAVRLDDAKLIRQNLENPLTIPTATNHGKKPMPGEHSKQLVRELKHSLFGGRPGGLSGTPELIPEVLRLGGMTDHEVGTPSIYRKKIGDLLGSARRYKTPALMAGGMMTGLMALRSASKKGWWEKLMDKFAMTKRASSLSDILGAALPSAALGVGGHLATSGKTYKNIFDPDRRLAVTYGEMEKPYFPADIGGGHKGPALGVQELLQQAMKAEPERWAELNPNVESIVRDRYGRLNPSQYGNRYNTIIDTGLGLNRQPTWQSTALEKSHGQALDPGIRAQNMQYLQSDLSHPVFKGEMGAAHPRRESYHRARMHQMLGTGPASRQVDFLRHGFGLVPGLKFKQIAEGSQPALRLDAMELLTQPKQSKAKMFDAAITHLTNPDNVKQYGTIKPLETAAQLTELKKPGMKYVNIQGSARGDYVASRAYELARELDKMGNKNVKIIAHMSGAYKESEMMKLVSNNKRIVVLPRLDQRAYVDLARNADINLGSYGASAYSESLASGSVMGMPDTWGKRQFYEHELGHPRIPQQGFSDYTVDTPRGPKTIFEVGESIDIRPGSTADRQLRLLASRPGDGIGGSALTKAHVDTAFRGVNVDQWNEGQQAYFDNEIMRNAKTTPETGVRYSLKGGAFTAETMADVAEVVTDDKLLKGLKAGAAERATRELGKIVAGRGNLVKTILTDATRAVQAQKVRGLLRFGGGLGLLGAGGLGAYNYFKG